MTGIGAAVATEEEEEEGEPTEAGGESSVLQNYTIVGCSNLN